MQLRSLADEVSRVSYDVGSLGLLGRVATLPDAEGVWQELTNNVNRMCTNLTAQVRGVAAVMTSVAKGDLTTLIDIEAEGEIAVLKNTVNAMVAQLRIFAREVIRVALEGE